MNVSKAHWRKWAIMLILSRKKTPMTTRELMDAIEKEGWNVLPKNGRLDAIHGTCQAASNNDHAGAHIQRHETRPIRWELTSIGALFVSDALADNPHITPEKSQEETFR